MLSEIEKIINNSVIKVNGISATNDEKQYQAEQLAKQAYNKLDEQFKFPDVVDWIVLNVLIPFLIKIAVAQLKKSGVIK